MGTVKTVLLFAAVGSISVVLAGCYGVTGNFRVGDYPPPPPDCGNGEPVLDLETVRPATAQ